MSDDLKDDALLWLTIIVVLLTVHEIVTGYQIGQRTDFIQRNQQNHASHSRIEQPVEPMARDAQR